MKSRGKAEGFIMRRLGIIFLAVALSLTISGCSSHPTNSPRLSGLAGLAFPHVIQSPQPPADWEFFSHGDHNTAGLAVGPDGNIWYTDGSGIIGKITMSGVITKYNLGANHEPQWIIRGPHASGD